MRLAGDPLGGLAHVGLHHGGLERALALGHHAGHLVGELAGGLDGHGHAAELGLGELVLADGLAEHDPVLGVAAGRLVGGLHHADGAGRGLQATVLEAGHLEVEALAQAVLSPTRFSAGTNQSSKAIS